MPPVPRPSPQTTDSCRKIVIDEPSVLPQNPCYAPLRGLIVVRVHMARVSTSDLWLMYSTLREDVDTYWQPIHDTENRTYLYPDPVVLSQPARRAVVRAVFAFAEASSFLLRQLLLSDFEERLEVEVVMALKELQISLANSGQVRK